METLIINTQKEGNAKFILDLIQKIGEIGRMLTKTEQEDFLLGELMLEEKTGKTISKDTIMKTLRQK